MAIHKYRTNSSTKETSSGRMFSRMFEYATVAVLSRCRLG